VRPPRLDRLADLASLRDALGRETADRQRREREAAVEKAVAEREANLFRDAVGAVEPLKVAARVQHQRQRPAPIAHQHRADEAAALAESLSDQFDPEDVVLEGDEQSSWQRDGISPDVLRKLRRGHWIVQGELDLHGARVDGAREMVAEFLREAIRVRHRCVRIVHGKGHGSIGKQPVLKGKVKRWLVQKDEVLAFCQAREHDGGGGALMVLLRPS
jgi:DNA-nicking Smr family endonuclease